MNLRERSVGGYGNLMVMVTGDCNGGKSNFHIEIFDIFH